MRTESRADQNEWPVAVNQPRVHYTRLIEIFHYTVIRPSVRPAFFSVRKFAPIISKNLCFFYHHRHLIGLFFFKKPSTNHMTDKDLHQSSPYSFLIGSLLYVVGADSNGILGSEIKSSELNDCKTSQRWKIN